MQASVSVRPRKGIVASYSTISTHPAFGDEAQLTHPIKQKVHPMGELPSFRAIAPGDLRPLARTFFQKNVILQS